MSSEMRVQSKERREVPVILEMKRELRFFDTNGEERVFTVARLGPDDRADVTCFFKEKVRRGAHMFESFIDAYISFHKQASWPFCNLIRDSQNQIVAFSSLDPTDPSARHLNAYQYLREDISNKAIFSIWKWTMEQLLPDLYKKEVKIPIFCEDGVIIGSKSLDGVKLIASIPAEERSGAHVVLQTSGFNFLGYDPLEGRIEWQIAMRKLLKIPPQLIQDQLYPLTKLTVKENVYTISPITEKDRLKAIHFSAKFAHPDQDVVQIVDRNIDETGMVFPLKECSLVICNSDGKMIGGIHVIAMRGNLLLIIPELKVKEQVLLFPIWKWILLEFLPDLLRRDEKVVLLDEENAVKGVGLLSEMTLKARTDPSDKATNDLFISKGAIPLASNGIEWQISMDSLAKKPKMEEAKSD